MKDTCYRVQPAGLDLGEFQTTTSNDNLANGVHVFGCMSELKGGVCGWSGKDWAPEIVTIECDSKDLRDNGDYEGYLLYKNRGQIIARQAFASWAALIEWAEETAE